ncbi:hypothetical protein DFH28DRAFT_924816 [Melampsora americana]|nr:hypothetical protein DFH28DRAFT_924816 [Melampsora americana]
MNPTGSSNPWQGNNRDQGVQSDANITPNSNKITPQANYQPQEQPTSFSETSDVTMVTNSAASSVSLADHQKLSNTVDGFARTMAKILRLQQEQHPCSCMSDVTASLSNIVPPSYQQLPSNHKPTQDFAQDHHQLDKLQALQQPCPQQQPQTHPQLQAPEQRPQFSQPHPQFPPSNSSLAPMTDFGLNGPPPGFVFPTPPGFGFTPPGVFPPPPTLLQHPPRQPPLHQPLSSPPAPLPPPPPAQPTAPAPATVPPIPGLDGLPFELPQLKSIPTFYKALVADFGDRDTTPTANKALRQLKQGPKQTSLSIDTQPYFYKFNSNSAIANVVNSWPEWHAVRTLKEKMRLAGEGQVVVKNADDLRLFEFLPIQMQSRLMHRALNLVILHLLALLQAARKGLQHWTMHMERCQAYFL